MGFWGMSDEGETAQKKASQVADFTAGAQGQIYQQGTDFGHKADAWDNYVRDYWAGRQQDPQASVEQMKSTGTQIMPGVDQALWQRGLNLDDLRKELGSVTSADETADTIQNKLYEKAKGIGDQYTTQDQLISDWAANAGLRNEQAGTNVKDSIGSLSNFLHAVNTDTYAPLRQTAGNMYSDLGTKSDAAYADLLKKSDATYGGLEKTAADANASSLADLELYKPAGEATAARVGRSYAPVKANALQRLRTSGIDPNSPQGQSMLASIEGDRARAMDDAIAASVDKYVSDKRNLGQTNLENQERIGTNKLSTTTGLTLGKESTGRDIATEGFNTESALSQKQGENASNIAQYTSEAQRQEAIRDLAEKQGISAAEAEKKMTNADTSFQRGQAWWDEQNNLDRERKAMQESDYALKSGLTDKLNEEALLNVSLPYEQFKAGQGYETTSTQNKNAAVTNLQNLSQKDYELMQTAQKIAAVYGEDAAKEYLTQYGIEAQNAGWGSKLLAGLGASLAQSWLKNPDDNSDD